MSQETAQTLYEKIMSSPAIQEQLIEELNIMRETGKQADWSKLATQHGFSEVSEQDVMDYADSMMTDDYELSDFELEMVAAASPTACEDQGA